MQQVYRLPRLDSVRCPILIYLADLGEIVASSPIENLRIHFYGVQGSGSIFPSLAERQEVKEILDLELLEKVPLDTKRLYFTSLKF